MVHQTENHVFVVVAVAARTRPQFVQFRTRHAAEGAATASLVTCPHHSGLAVAGDHEPRTHAPFLDSDLFHSFIVFMPTPSGNYSNFVQIIQIKYLCTSADKHKTFVKFEFNL